MSDVLWASEDACTNPADAVVAQSDGLGWCIGSSSDGGMDDHRAILDAVVAQSVDRGQPIHIRLWDDNFEEIGEPIYCAPTQVQTFSRCGYVVARMANDNGVIEYAGVANHFLIPIGKIASILL